MSDESRDSATGALVAGILLGAASMYFLDPDRGRRRRALARDKVTSTADRMSNLATAALHDARGRFRGVAAGAKRAMAHAEIPDDLQLIERVRSKIGRVVGNPHAIHVGAHEGRVLLSGDVLAREASRLRETVRAVPGVRELDDRLVLHESSSSVPSLQGAEERSRMRATRGDRWSPATRGIALAAGALVLLRAVEGSGIARIAAAGLGLVLGLSVGTEATGRHKVAHVTPQQPSDADESTGGDVAAERDETSAGTV